MGFYSVNRLTNFYFIIKSKAIVKIINDNNLVNKIYKLLGLKMNMI